MFSVRFFLSPAVEKSLHICQYLFLILQIKSLEIIKQLSVLAHSSHILPYYSTSSARTHPVLTEPVFFIRHTPRAALCRL